MENYHEHVKMMNMKTASGREKKSKREVRDFPCFCFPFRSSLTFSIHSLSFCFFIFSSHPLSYLLFPCFLPLPLCPPYSPSSFIFPVSFSSSLLHCFSDPLLNPPFHPLVPRYLFLPFLSHFLHSIICFD